MATAHVHIARGAATSPCKYERSQKETSIRSPEKQGVRDEESNHAWHTLRPHTTAPHTRIEQGALCASKKKKRKTDATWMTTTSGSGTGMLQTCESAALLHTHMPGAVLLPAPPPPPGPPPPLACASSKMRTGSHFDNTIAGEQGISNMGAKDVGSD